MAHKTEAKLNRDGIVSDRRLWLEKDGFTITDDASKGRMVLAGEDVLIPTDEVKRLGLDVSGGKVVQTKDNARGGPETLYGRSPQSAPWPPSTDANGKDMSLDEPEWDPMADAPKSDFRHDPDAKRRALPTQGLVPLKEGEREELEEVALEEGIEQAHARAPMQAMNLVRDASLREEGKSGAKKAKRSKK
jgi:hypothetical protein